MKERRERVRSKHWLNGNSLKMYDKGSVLRVASLVREPGDFKVYRAKEGDAHGPKDWRPLRQGIADLHRRAEVRQAASDRYLSALTAVRGATPLRQLVEPLCRPALEPVRPRRSPQAAPAQPEPAAHPLPPELGAAAATANTAAARPRRLRALNPLAAADAARGIKIRASPEDSKV